ncbi:antitoxin VapB1 [Kutzneria kofuensis]
MSTTSSAALNQRYPDDVATIQIRDLPDDTYRTIRLRAESAGQSIQAYMRDQVIAMAAKKTKQEVIAIIEAGLAESGGADPDKILAYRDEERR